MASLKCRQQSCNFLHNFKWTCHFNLKSTHFNREIAAIKWKFYAIIQLEMSVYYYSIRLINKASGFSTAAKQRCHADQLVLDEKTIKEMWKTCSLPSDVFTFSHSHYLWSHMTLLLVTRFLLQLRWRSIMVVFKSDMTEKSLYPYIIISTPLVTQWARYFSMPRGGV